MGSSAELLQLRYGVGEVAVLEGGSLLDGFAGQIAGLIGVAEAGVGDAEDVQGVGDAPGVPAVRLAGAAQQPIRWLDCGMRVAGGEVDVAEIDTDVERPSAEAAGVSEVDAVEGLGAGQGGARSWRVISATR